MANALYDTGRNAFLRGDLSWNSNTFKVVLLSSSYTLEILELNQLLSLLHILIQLSIYPSHQMVETSH